jgi:hypothetical protein
MKKIGIVIAAALFMGCATPSPAEVITGFTVDMGAACWVDDLSTENMALVTLWWSLNKKHADGTLTQEEYDQGSALEMSGKCGLLRGGTPVTVVLSDGTIMLLEFPDGMLAGVTDGAFTETPLTIRTIPVPSPVTGKEFKVDED